MAAYITGVVFTLNIVITPLWPVMKPIFVIASDAKPADSAASAPPAAAQSALAPAVAARLRAFHLQATDKCPNPDLTLLTLDWGDSVSTPALTGATTNSAAGTASPTIPSQAASAATITLSPVAADGPTTAIAQATASAPA